MLGNANNTLNQDLEIEDPRDGDLRRDLLLSLEPPPSEKMHEKLEFLARALGDAIDQLREENKRADAPEAGRSTTRHN